MSTVRKVKDALRESTAAAAAAHEAKLERHRKHLALIRKQREEAEAAAVAEQVLGSGG